MACDFVDGWAFGGALGVGVRSVSGWWTVTGASLASSELTVRCQFVCAMSHRIEFMWQDQLNINLLKNITIAPTQARIVPLSIDQLLPFGGADIPILLHLVSRENNTKTLYTRISVRQLPHWSPSEVPADGIKATYFYGTTMPTTFLVKPPDEPNEGPPKPPILALRMFSDLCCLDVGGSSCVRRWGRTRYPDYAFLDSGDPQPEAQLDHRAHRSHCMGMLHMFKRTLSVLTRQPRPQGLDWHGPSAVDAWSCVDALYEILINRDAWRGYKLAQKSQVLLLGHSNGGQGAWWNAGRYPDRLIAGTCCCIVLEGCPCNQSATAVIPAAAYIKSQAYVPLIQSR